jgi:hypothetical protein
LLAPWLPSLSLSLFLLSIFHLLNSIGCAIGQFFLCTLTWYLNVNKMGVYIYYDILNSVVSKYNLLLFCFVYVLCFVVLCCFCFCFSVFFFFSLREMWIIKPMCNINRRQTPFISFRRVLFNYSVLNSKMWRNLAKHWMLYRKSWLFHSLIMRDMFDPYMVWFHSIQQ